MKLTKSENAEVNYLAKIVDIQSFRPHSNPEVTRLKCCTIDGFNIYNKDIRPFCEKNT